MSWQWRVIQKLRRNWLVILKLTGTSHVFFNWLLVTKVYIAWATKVWRSYLSWHWRVMQILKKDWPVVWKKTWEIWQIFTRAPKVSKLELWWDPFVQSRKGMNLKFTEELCVMTMKNNAKFEEELTFYFKTDSRNLTNFDSSTWKLKKKMLFNLLFKCPRKLSS